MSILTVRFVQRSSTQIDDLSPNLTALHDYEILLRCPEAFDGFRFDRRASVCERTAKINIPRTRIFPALYLTIGVRGELVNEERFTRRIYFSSRVRVGGFFVKVHHDDAITVDASFRNTSRCFRPVIALPGNYASAAKYVTNQIGTYVKRI